MNTRDMEKLRAAKEKLWGVANHLLETPYPGMTDADKVAYYALCGMVDALATMIKQAGEDGMKEYYNGKAT